MKQLPGCTVVELTDDKIVQEEDYDSGNYKVHARHVGNPNPPPKEHQETINAVAKILIKGHQRRLMAEQTKVGA